MPLIDSVLIKYHYRHWFIYFLTALLPDGPTFSLSVTLHKHHLDSLIFLSSWMFNQLLVIFKLDCFCSSSSLYSINTVHKCHDIKHKPVVVTKPSSLISSFPTSMNSSPVWWRTSHNKEKAEPFCFLSWLKLIVCVQLSGAMEKITRKKNVYLLGEYNRQFGLQ